MHLDVKIEKKNTFNSLDFLKWRANIKWQQKLHTTSTFSKLGFQESSCWEENSQVVNILGVIYFSDIFSLQILAVFVPNYEIWKLSCYFLHLVDQVYQKTGRSHSTLW